jgi:hypothetical protein
MSDATPRKRSEWTVLVYMVADDPKGGEVLDEAANREIDQVVYATLAAKQRGADLQTAIQVDFRTQPGVFRRIVDGGASVIPEGDSANPDTLYGFFKWATTHCPASKYMLIFWGHSHGPFGLFSDPDPWEWKAQTLNLLELRKALSEAAAQVKRPVDIVIFKDCYMATMEIACELRGLATYLIASQGLVPIDIWPYEAMFGKLVGKPDVEKVARGELRVLGERYKQSDDVPFTLINTAHAEGALHALAGVASALKTLHPKGTQFARVRKSLANAVPTFGDPSLLDVRELCLALARHPSDGVRTTARALDAATANDLVMEVVAKRVWTPNAGDEKRKRSFGGISVFAYPASSAQQDHSNISPVSSATAYRALNISSSGWDALALEKMPAAQMSAAATPLPQGLPEFARALFPIAVLEALQTSGLLEQLQRNATDMAQRTIVDLQGSALAESDELKSGKFKSGKFKSGKFKSGKFKSGKFGGG